MDEQTYTLYKYRPLYMTDAKGVRQAHPFTAAIFQRSEIYYSAPNSFNDPFDCNLKLSAEGSSKEDLDRYFSTLVSGYSRAERRKLEKEIAVARANKEEARYFREAFGKTHKDYYDNSSVFCLSRKNNSIPMFSYYADSHRGIAIEFCFSLGQTPCGIQPTKDSDGKLSFGGKVEVGEIDYHSKLPDLNFFRLSQNPRSLTRTLLFSKHHEWAHEKEFRIFRHKCGPASVKVPNELITRVILGCKTGDEEISLVKEWLKGWPTDIKISKAMRADDAFDLRIEEVDLLHGRLKQ